MMGILETIKRRSAELKEGLNGVREDVAAVRNLIRQRTGEMVEQALVRREGDNAPASGVRQDTVRLSNDVFVGQIDSATISVGSQRFSQDQLSIPDPELSLTQHDLNSEFTPLGWSCRLGTGNNSLFVAAYEGIAEGERPREKILVVKNAHGALLRVFAQPFQLHTELADSEGEIQLDEEMMLSKKDQNTLTVGGREFSLEQFMRVINPNTRISCDAEGLTEEKILTTYNKLDWSCTLGTGDARLMFTVYESKSTKKRNVVITDSTGKIRGELFSAIFKSPNW